MIIAVFAPLVFLVLAFGVLQFYHSYANARYADQVFGAAFEVEEVIASKKYHGVFTSFGCSYAVVRVSAKDADSLTRSGPDSIDRHHFKTQAFWPTGWRALPFPNRTRHACAEGGPAIPCCLNELSNDNRSQILEGLAGSSGWYDANSENVAFVLPDQRLVGIVRYGD